MSYILADRSRVNLALDSRFRNTNMYQDTETGDFFWGNWGCSAIEPDESDTFHEVTSGEVNRLDLISYHEYGTVRLWWVIALANKITNPLKISAGMRLRIPSLERIYGKVNP